MLTRCPACQTLFRVTPEQLRAQSGRVRCGQCQHAFNALDTLLEEPATRILRPPPVEHLAPAQTLEQLEHIPEPASSDTIAEATDAPDTPDTITTPPIETPRKSFWRPLWRTSAEPASTPGPAIGPEIAAAPEPAPPQEPRVTETAVLPAPTFEPVPEPESEAPAASTPVIEMLEPAAEPETEPALEPAPEPTPEHPEPFFILAPPAPRRWPWLVGSLLALLTLAAQMTLAFRVELATRMPDTRPALIALCDLAGCEMGLPAKAELIGIEASDLHPDPQHAERLNVSATLKNRAPFAQAWPRLELTLTDTADKAIARKVLAPVEYLPAPDSKTALAAGMPPNGEAAVNFSVATDNLAASGYRLYLFYP